MGERLFLAPSRHDTTGKRPLPRSRLTAACRGARSVSLAGTSLLRCRLPRPPLADGALLFLQAMLPYRGQGRIRP